MISCINTSPKEKLPLDDLILRERIKARFGRIGIEHLIPTDVTAANLNENNSFERTYHAVADNDSCTVNKSVSLSSSSSLQCDKNEFVDQKHDEAITSAQHTFSLRCANSSPDPPLSLVSQQANTSAHFEYFETETPRHLQSNKTRWSVCVWGLIVLILGIVTVVLIMLWIIKRARVDHGGNSNGSDYLDELPKNVKTNLAYHQTNQVVEFQDSTTSNPFVESDTSSFRSLQQSHVPLPPQHVVSDTFQNARSYRTPLTTCHHAQTFKSTTSSLRHQRPSMSPRPSTTTIIRGMDNAAASTQSSSLDPIKTARYQETTISQKTNANATTASAAKPSHGTGITIYTPAHVSFLRQFHTNNENQA